jgi:phosphatidylglycerophosphate synthase
MGPILGLIAQVALLALLAMTVGLGAAAWAVGIACGAFTCVTLVRSLTRADAPAFGPADWVTLLRVTLVGGVAALTVESVERPVPIGLFMVVITVALVLDAVDGQVARRTGTVSPLGARFDGEVDAFLILVLSVYLIRSIGAWVLAIGAMRYAFMLAGWVLPWMDAPLPYRFWRKTVAAVQGIVLAFAAADVLPRPVSVTALVGALALLSESFGRDVVWLWRQRSRVSHVELVGPPVCLRPVRVQRSPTLR